MTTIASFTHNDVGFEEILEFLHQNGNEEVKEYCWRLNDLYVGIQEDDFKD